MKRILYFLFILVSYAVAVDFPEQQEKRGLKRAIEELMPQQGPTADDILINAAQTGDLDTLHRVLAQTRYSINRRYENGKTLLIYAAATGQDTILNDLIECGANINLSDQQGNTALHYAAIYNHVAVVMRLLQDDDLQLNRANSEGQTPLLSAFLNNSTQVIALLLTPVLVARGLDINKATNQNFSPLAFAIIRADLPLVNRLLQLGAQIGFITPSATVLQYAVARQQEAIVERLLQIPSLDVNQTNPKGETALMVAALIGNLNIARLLIAKGARVALKDEDGSTALDFAKASDSPQKNAMIKLLRDAKKSQRR
jgi:ankyrin repeat protein